MECITCHDPHIRSTEGENIKFLRVNRFQKAQPAEGAAFDKANDIICLACHQKEGWALSAHANSDSNVAVVRPILMLRPSCVISQGDESVAGGVFELS